MFKVLDEVCQPKKATKYSACIDLFAREDITIGAGEIKIVPLGVKIDLGKITAMLIKNDNINTSGFKSTSKLQEYRFSQFNKFLLSHKLDIHIRSSLSAKKGLIIANGTGQIDLDYHDEIGIILHNPYNPNNYMTDDFTKLSVFPTIGQVKIKKGDKVAQITLVEHKSFLMGYESEEERIGGYGSTGE